MEECLQMPEDLVLVSHLTVGDQNEDSVAPTIAIRERFHRQLEGPCHFGPSSSLDPLKEFRYLKAMR